MNTFTQTCLGVVIGLIIIKFGAVILLAIFVLPISFFDWLLDNDEPAELASYEYSYRVEIPAGFQGEFMYQYHDTPEARPQVSGWFTLKEETWESQTYTVSFHSQNPRTHIQARNIRKIDVLENASGLLSAQIIIDGFVVREETRHLPDSDGVDIILDLLNDYHDLPN